MLFAIPQTLYQLLNGADLIALRLKLCDAKTILRGFHEATFATGRLLRFRTGLKNRVTVFSWFLPTFALPISERQTRNEQCVTGDFPARRETPDPSDEFGCARRSPGAHRAPVLRSGETRHLFQEDRSGFQKPFL